MARLAASSTIAARNNGFGGRRTRGGARLGERVSKRDGRVRGDGRWPSGIPGSPRRRRWMRRSRRAEADARRARRRRRDGRKEAVASRTARSPPSPTRDSLQALSKLVEVVDGKQRIVSQRRSSCRFRERPRHRGIETDELEHGQCTTESCAPTGRPCRAIAATCSRGSRSWTWRARWSASGASAPAPSSSCSRVATSATRSSCRSRRRRTSVLEDHLPKSRYQPG